MEVKEKLALIKGDYAKRWAEAKVEIKGISDKSEKVAKMLTESAVKSCATFLVNWNYIKSLASTSMI
jgi:F0F1-type ATP synthase membrane subunit b/b'